MPPLYVTFHTTDPGYTAEAAEATMTRIDLASRAVGVGVELGVAAADYSAALLQHGRLDRLYSVDRWTDHHDEAEMMRAREALAPFGDRSIILRATFADAVGRFADESLDFIYIDGYAHTGQEGGRTLADWWPKLKPGGIFAGHDYCRQYQPTMDAVDAFAAAHGLTVNVTDEPDLPSWWIVKP